EAAGHDQLPVNLSLVVVGENLVEQIADMRFPLGALQLQAALLANQAVRGTAPAPALTQAEPNLLHVHIAFQAVPAPGLWFHLKAIGHGAADWPIARLALAALSDQLANVVHGSCRELHGLRREDAAELRGGWHAGPSGEPLGGHLL